MKRHFGSLWQVAVASALLGAGFLMASPASSLAHAEHGHPARIHEGTCDALGKAAFQLNGVGGSIGEDGAPIATPEAINPDNSYQVMIGETTIDTPLDTLLAADHAVMIYESDEEMNAIACGNVGGAMTGDMLVTGLAEAGVPGHTGFALFTPEGDQTRVTILIGHGLSPVSAGGAVHDDSEDAGHGDTMGDSHSDDGHDDEGDHDAAMATPAA
ncbi:MAG: hypothetical protein U0031_05905 [Thermomicrobiales bacterium]